MVKKCIICSEEAKFCIKNISGYYCDKCAIENFSSLELLQKLDEHASKIKQELKKLE